MVHLQIDEGFQAQNYEGALTEAAQSSLRHLKQPENAEITIVLGDDAQIQALNREHLGVDAPTDVLAFPFEGEDPESEGPYLGDLIISQPRAALQAEAAGHPIKHELQLLVIHGVLHLLGYDHHEAEEKEKMWEAQAAILDEIGITVSLPAES